ncbi:MAG: hypothetical protein ONB12_11715 [candidate division KSB1 bacterium]|nr:hypothetical protein [candidate division KSB1 bacterium]
MQKISSAKSAALKNFDGTKRFWASLIKSERNLQPLKAPILAALGSENTGIDETTSDYAESKINKRYLLISRKNQFFEKKNFF